MSNAAVVLYRSLLRTARRCRQAPVHHDITAGVRSGIVRANKASHVGGLLQVEARSGELETGIRTAFSAEERRKHGDAHFNNGFVLLRRLVELDASLEELGASGAFCAVDWRPDHVKFGVGQPLSHEDWGLCVVYGWEERCDATTPEGSGALDGIVDNRVHFSGIDEEDECEEDEEGEQEQAAAAADDADAEAAGAFLEQPFYRVLLADGSARFVAQERLRPVGRDEGLKRVIQGTSFFFTGTEKNAGWYIANPHLAARFPEDAAAIRAAGRGSQLGFKLTACATDI